MGGRATGAGVHAPGAGSLRPPARHVLL